MSSNYGSLNQFKCRKRWKVCSGREVYGFKKTDSPVLIVIAFCLKAPSPSRDPFILSPLCNNILTNFLNFTVFRMDRLGMDLNQADYDGRTALHLACVENHPDIVNYLLNECHVWERPKDRCVWNIIPTYPCLSSTHGLI